MKSLDGPEPLSPEEVGRLSAYDRGYAAYMQAVWNPAVPKKNPYPRGSQNEKDWRAGQQAAVIHAQETGD